jgi:16S rRNA (cytidine1402-2'-O)-methyltransferase
MSGAGDKPLEAGLYVVSTPIGNLGDFSFRALDVLKRADLILAEDTRVAAKLLSAYGVKNRVERYDDHADAARTAQVLDRLKEGARVALVSDAGTPLVSDPGYRLVSAAAEAALPVIPVPGASALLAALAICGLPTDRFTFAGFAPPKSAARKSFLEAFVGLPGTLVFYETGPRLKDSLTDMAAVLGDRPAAVCRELTKLYETCIRAPLSTLAEDPRLDTPKGEIVVVIGPGEAAAASEDEVERALIEAVGRLGPSAGAAEVAKAYRRPKRELYQRALALKGAR